VVKPQKLSDAPPAPLIWERRMTDHTNTYPDLVNVEDWLNAKGYTGEAGACHQAMSLIRKQEKRIAALEAAIDEAIEYVAGHDDEWPKALAVRLRAARAAYLGEKE
jgi:hypothetical protein